MTFGWPRIHVPVLTSTMSAMATLAAEGARHGTVLTCDFQTDGKGRQGRPWHAPVESSLLMSVLLRTSRSPAALPLLSLLVAEAVASSVSHFGAHPRVKWPNDVLIDDRKVSGILLRSSVSPLGSMVIAGIGVNLRRHAEVDHSATSIETSCGRILTGKDVLDVLVPELDAVTMAFEQQIPGPILERLRGRLAFVGEHVEVLAAGGSIVGTIVGLANDGALQIEIADGSVLAVHSGDVLRGPRRHATSGF